MKKNFILVAAFVVATIFSFVAEGQLFEKIYSREISFSDYFQNKILIPLPVRGAKSFEFVAQPMTENNSGIIYFFTIDTTNEATYIITTKKCKKDKYGWYYVLGVDNMLKIEKDYYFFSGTFLQKLKRGNHCQILYHFNYLQDPSKKFDAIWSLNNDTLLLFDHTYNPIYKETYTPFKFALFDIKHKKILRDKSIDVGKGIFYTSYWESEARIIDAKNNKIVLAHPSKPEFYIINKSLEIEDTVKLSFLFKYKSDSILNLTLTDNFIRNNIHNPKGYMAFFIENHLLSLPRIVSLSFINDDLVLCAVASGEHPEENVESGYKKQKMYVYSIKLHQFIDSSNTDSLQVFSFGASVPIYFINGKLYEFRFDLDSITEKIKYTFEIFKYIGNTAKDMKLSAINLDSINLYDKYGKRQNIDLSYYKYVLAPDIFICVHCFEYLKNEKRLLIILPYEKNITKNIELKKSFQAYFPKSKFLYVKQKMSIQKNKLYLLKHRRNK